MNSVLQDLQTAPAHSHSGRVAAGCVGRVRLGRGRSMRSAAVRHACSERERENFPVFCVCVSLLGREQVVGIRL